MVNGGGVELGRDPQLLLIPPSLVLSSSDLFVRVLVKCGVGVGLPRATLRMASGRGEAKIVYWERDAR